MSKMNEDAYENKRALPNKMLNEDGSVTDLLGNPVVPTDEAYKKRPALPNKWLNADGTYSTLQEILGGAIDTDIFIVVEELPQTGEENKIYLVPDGEGGFNEYHYINGEWDPVGAIDMGVSPQVFYWDGLISSAGYELWDKIVEANEVNDVLVQIKSMLTPTMYSYSVVIIKKGDLYTPSLTNQQVHCYANPVVSTSHTNSITEIKNNGTDVLIQFTNNKVSSITLTPCYSGIIDCLSTTRDYQTPYIPQYDGSPATKKYVDDKVSPQVFYWNGKIDQTGVDFWNNLIPYNHDSALTVIVGGIDGINSIPSIIYVTPNFLVEKSSSIHVYSYRYDNTFNSSSTSVIGLGVMDYTLVFQEDKQIRAIYSLNRSLQREILDTNNNYPQPYIPQYPGSPATKKYVDDKVFYLPISSSDTTTITWSNLYNAYNSNNIIIAKIDYLSNSISVPMTVPLYCMMGDQTGGTVLFTFVMGMEVIMYMVTGTGENICTITKQENNLEILSNKAQSIISNNTSQDKYPSTKAVFDEFQRRPVIVWQSNTPSEYLKAIQANLSASPTWQLTNLDLTAFKSIKIYSCAGQGTGSTASASTTPSIILEMSLDSRAAIAAYGGNYVASVVVQKPNDDNRLATLTCVVSADKTKFTVLRQTNLYGTAATSNNDVNANVFMIEGYYADGITLPDGDNTQY